MLLEKRLLERRIEFTTDRMRAGRIAGWRRNNFPGQQRVDIRGIEYSFVLRHRPNSRSHAAPWVRGDDSTLGEGDAVYIEDQTKPQQPINRSKDCRAPEQIALHTEVSHRDLGSTAPEKVETSGTSSAGTAGNGQETILVKDIGGCGQIKE
ncbi:MAG: hypothetical protein B9S34_02830 [Opitutia bacterium Tous-C1TDCM]|nr:MAG: hypothetical protein B9S34_02830 [Opitutae bacterium Tous-C1TDCM]